MKSASRSVLLSLLFALTNAHPLPSQDDYATPILAGISNHGRNKGQPYVTAGDRTYLIGTQDGNFPDMGSHVEGEMGGLWLHPIKLIDGFWATVTDRTTHQAVALTESADFVTYPYGNQFSYRPVLDGLEIERFQFSPDGQEGMIVQYEFKNAADRRRQLQLQLAVKTDLSPVWYSDRLGIKDAQDTVAWDAAHRVFIASDAANPWFAVWGAAGSAEAQPVAHPEPIQTKGMGVTAASRYGLSVEPNGTSTLTFVIAGSAKDRKAAVDTYHYLAANQASLLEEKKAQHAAPIDPARRRNPGPRPPGVHKRVGVDGEWLAREV